MKNYFNELVKLSKNAYSPYSEFQVAAIIVTKDGEEYKGVNIENASFGATLCAERSAISSALSDGVNGNDIIEIHLIGKPRKFKGAKFPLTTPCGICRQFIGEITNDSVNIIIYRSESDFKEFNMEDLLPNAFTGDELDYE
jgi:cytidine deaminase